MQILNIIGSKGYVSPTSPENIQFNEELKDKYDDDPRIFWSDKNHQNHLHPILVATAIFVLSVLSASANCERQFSRMAALITSRRSSFTANNANKILVLSNLLPQKRRLENIMAERNIKKQKLFHLNA
jgi:hypothetical protein